MKGNRLIYIASACVLTLFVIGYQPCSLAAQELSIAGVQNLKFGEDIFPGVERSVKTDQESAALYEINGSPAAEVRLSFELPSSIFFSEGDQLAIEFEPGSAAYATTDRPGFYESFNPADGLTTNLGPDTGKLFIRLGGTVVPYHTQRKGTYTGPVVLHVEYTGN